MELSWIMKLRIAAVAAVGVIFREYFSLALGVSAGPVWSRFC